MSRQKFEKIKYHKREEKAVIIYNVNTGKGVAGFKNIHTDSFKKSMDIKNSRDIDLFMEKYELSVVGIQTIHQ